MAAATGDGFCSPVANQSSSSAIQNSGLVWAPMAMSAHKMTLFSSVKSRLLDRIWLITSVNSESGAGVSTTIGADDAGAGESKSMLVNVGNAAGTKLSDGVGVESSNPKSIGNGNPSGSIWLSVGAVTLVSDGVCAASGR